MVVIYTSPTCGQCRTVKMFLESKKIAYVACEDVEKMKSLSISHTPTLQTPSGALLTGPDIVNWIREEAKRGGN